MWPPEEGVAREMEVQGKSMQEAYNEHKILLGYNERTMIAALVSI